MSSPSPPRSPPAKRCRFDLVFHRDSDSSGTSSEDWEMGEDAYRNYSSGGDPYPEYSSDVPDLASGEEDAHDTEEEELRYLWQRVADGRSDEEDEPQDGKEYYQANEEYEEDEDAEDYPADIKDGNADYDGDGSGEEKMESSHGFGSGLSEALRESFREFAEENQDPPPDEKYFTDFCHPSVLPPYVKTVGDLDRYYRFRVHCLIDGDEPALSSGSTSVDGQISQGSDDDEEDDATSDLIKDVVHEGPVNECPVM
ncbi:hypothetical protein ACP70R_036835 [Stipagrostis hirtigluma subsp. patula]